MAIKTLLLVESLAKAKTIREHLSEHDKVLASYGHVQTTCCKQDETTNSLSISYQLINENQKRINAIIVAAKKADEIYLATNSDTEGEALAWQLETLLQPLNNTIKRIHCHEVTELALQNSLKNALNTPSTISTNQADAYQAQQVIDQLTSRHLSTLVSTKIHHGLTLNRYQFDILQLITERERLINAFEPVDYWQIQATLQINGQQLSAKLTHYENQPLTNLSITNEALASQIQSSLLSDAQNTLTVGNIEITSHKESAPEPFNTVDLLKAAAEKIGFSIKRTLRTAQQLYEGVNTAKGRTGLISYFYTQSKTLNNQTQKSVKAEIVSQFGHEMLSESRQTDDEHQTNHKTIGAIHPACVQLTPKSLKKHLSADQFKLYDLIWKRTLASQMRNAELTTTKITLTTEKHQFESSCTSIDTLGFLATDNTKEIDTKNTSIPELIKGESVSIEELQLNQLSTKPLNHHTELDLICALDQHQVTQLSAYSTSITSLQDAGYATIRQKQFHSTEIGTITSQFIAQHLPQLTDFHFSTTLENTLDSITLDNSNWQEKIRQLWLPLDAKIQKAMQQVDRKDVIQETIDEQCPKCSNALTVRLGKLGRFIGCENYPKCDYTRNLGDKHDQFLPKTIEDRACPACQSSLVVKQGKFGEFIGCSTFPTCRYIEPKEKPEATQVTCPECNGGILVKRQSRTGSIFYSCHCYPSCSYAVWYPPIAENCPTCHWSILTIKQLKNKKIKKICPQTSCDFSITYSTKTPTS